MAFNKESANKFLISADTQIAGLVKQSKQLKDVKNYEEIRLSIEQLTRGKLSSVKVHFFGSRIIGLANPKSDLDIFVETSSDSWLSLSVLGTNKFDELVKSLKNSSDWRIKEEVRQTAVPIIITVFNPLKMDCDLNVQSSLGTCNSKLLAHLFEVQPEAVPLFHFIRIWLEAQGFHKLKGYTLTLLVIFFLQSINCFPSIETLQKGVSWRKIDGWAVQFDPSRNCLSYKCNSMLNYKSYVKEFFKFYKNFHFASQVISPYFGKTLDVSNYRSRYQKFFKKGLYIAGPVNQEKNCGIVDDSVRNDFINLIKASSDYLENVNL